MSLKPIPSLADSDISIPGLELTAKQIIDRSTVIYGPSGSGKTFMINHILDVIASQKNVPEIFVFCPSNSAHGNYDGRVPPAMILPYPFSKKDLVDPRTHKEVSTKAATIKYLSRIWERQESKAKAYNEFTNNIVLLQKLYSFIRTTAYDAKFAEIKRKYEKIKDRIRAKFSVEAIRKSEYEKIDKIFGDFCCLIYRKAITEPANYFRLKEAAGSLPDDLVKTLSNIDMQPRIALVFDDCAAEIKEIAKESILKNLFYRNRHVYTTIVFACQDDSNVPPDLRKNAFTSIFTERNVLMTYFGRASSGFGKEQKEYVKIVADSIFGCESVKFAKFMHYREDPKGEYFYYTVAKPVERKMLVPRHVFELCEKSTDKNLLSTNRFAKGFL